MNEEKLEAALEAVFNLGVEITDELSEYVRANTFEEEGVLTRNKGLVLRFADGSEFQLTIVQSRRSRD